MIAKILVVDCFETPHIFFAEKMKEIAEVYSAYEPETAMVAFEKYKDKINLIGIGNGFEESVIMELVKKFRQQTQVPIIVIYSKGDFFDIISAACTRVTSWENFIDVAKFHISLQINNFGLAHRAT